MRLWLCSIRKHCEAVLMSQCHLQQLLVWQQRDKERWNQFNWYQHLGALFFLFILVLGSPIFLGPPCVWVFPWHSLFHIEIEARCHLRVIAIWLRFLPALTPVRELVREPPDVLCTHKSTIQINILCLLYILLQLCMCTSVWEISKGSTAAL